MRWIRRPEAALFALVFGTYVYFYQAGGWNQNSRFDLARALVERHQIKIDHFVYNTGDYAYREGYFYSDKAPGVSLVAAVPYWFVHALSDSAPPSSDFLGWASWGSTVVAVALPSALGVVALAVLLAAFGIPERRRLALAAAWGLATLALPYSTLLIAHQLVASLLVMTFALYLRIARGIDPPSRLRLVLAGLLSGWAVACEYPALLCVMVLTIYGAHVVSYRRLVWIALGGLGPALVLAWYHTAGFGAPWHLPYEYAAQKSQHVGLLGVGSPSATALWHVTLSPYRGLFFSAPWLLLALPGAVAAWRRGARDEVGVCSAIVVLLLWLNISYNVWHGGRAIGPRHLVPAIPFLVILASGWLSSEKLSKLRIAAVAVLVGWSAFVMLACTAVEPEVDASIKHPLGEYVLPRFARGELAISEQSVDMPLEGHTGVRYAWNLGEQLGLDGLPSLLPLLAWWAAGCALLARRSRQR